MTDLLYFDDIPAGTTFVGATVTVERTRMLAFAAEFDDQPMHLDDDAARALGLREALAPGSFGFALHTRSLAAIWKTMHLLPGGVGITLDFVAPLYAGDTLTAHVEVRETRASSKPGRGWLECRVRCVNQHGEAVIRADGHWLVRARTRA